MTSDLVLSQSVCDNECETGLILVMYRKFLTPDETLALTAILLFNCMGMKFMYQMPQSAQCLHNMFMWLTCVSLDHSYLKIKVSTFHW